MGGGTPHQTLRTPGLRENQRPGTAKDTRLVLKPGPGPDVPEHKAP